RAEKVVRWRCSTALDILGAASQRPTECRHGRTVARVRALALIGTLCVVAWPAAAQPGDDDTSTSRANSRNAPTEEVTVRGRRSLAAYRRDVEAAHDRVLAIFNEINSNDEF